MTITIIAAMSENRVIGRGGSLPWRLPADLARFKARTMGHTVVMGRKTYDSIGRALPGRDTIVLTRDPDWCRDDAVVVHTVEDVLRRLAPEREAFILGGGEIYRLLLPHADRLDLTIVHGHVEGDTLFPELDLDGWTLVEDERHEADERHAFAFSFRRYERTRR